MKKSLSKILARMARDGDVETVAEIIEEMMAPEDVPAEAAEETETVAEVVEEPAAVVETEAGNTIVVDEATLGGIIERLDRIIELLTPAPAQDEDPVEGEPLKAAGGGNSVRGEVNRNEQAPQCGAATIEAAVAEAVEEAIEAATAEETEEVLLPEVTSAEEISEMVGEILDPLSGAIEETGETEDECGEQEPEVISTGDALRAALRAVGPALAKMPLRQRQRVSADIAARLNGKGGRKGADAGIYAALASARRRPGANPADLGKRIMANRSANRKH